MPSPLDLAFLALIAVAWPLYDQFVDWPRFLRRLRDDPDRARPREYRGAILLEWLLAMLALGLWQRAGRPWAAIGLRAPDGWRQWAAAAAVLLLGAMYAWQAAAVARSPRTRRYLRERFVATGLADLLPHTRAELGQFLALSVTAGVCEELLFRGYFISTLAPSLGWWGAAALALPAFGLLHAYQGRRGVVRTAAVGAVLTLVVAATGSLLPAMVLHAVIDIGSGAIGWLAFDDPAAGADAAVAETPAAGVR